MKAVAEIVAAIILLASGGYSVPKAAESFKKEIIGKVHKGPSPPSSFINNLTSPLKRK